MEGAGEQAEVVPVTSLLGRLEDAISSLQMLDGERLETIEREIATMLATGQYDALFARDKSERARELGEVIARQRVLGKLLENTNLNLNVLRGLHRRNRMGSSQWVL